MKIGILQFSVSRNISENLNKICNAIIEASLNGTQLLVTQECALCGYPPLEIPSINMIEFEMLEKCVSKITELARKNNIHIALGLIRKVNSKCINSIAFIAPDGIRGYYDKRALWGWDKENFTSGTTSGPIFDVNGTKFGVRICFEIRFPEYFRELYREEIDFILISFCDISKNKNIERLKIIESHLITRAIENAKTVISVNSTTFHQTAPTCVIDPDGRKLIEAINDKEDLIYYEFEKTEENFGRKGRCYYNNILCINSS